MKYFININAFLDKHTQTLPPRFVSRHFAKTRQEILYWLPEASLSRYRQFYTIFGDLSHLIRKGLGKNFVGYNVKEFILSTNC